MKGTRSVNTHNTTMKYERLYSTPYSKTYLKSKNVVKSFSKVLLKCDVGHMEASSLGALLPIMIFII